MRMLVPLCAIRVSSGIVIALYLPQAFSLGAWVGGLMLLVFAWIGRFAVNRGSRARVWTPRRRRNGKSANCGILLKRARSSAG